MKPIRIPCTCTAPDLIPGYLSVGSSGADLHADIPVGKTITIRPGHRKLIPTGLHLEIPQGYEAQIRPRSGLSLKHGITVLNTPGTIDSDYRGEIQVIVVNLGRRSFRVTRGMRIAQIVIAPVMRAEFRLSERIAGSVRGEGGFGSTGTQ